MKRCLSVIFSVLIISAVLSLFGCGDKNVTPSPDDTVISGEGLSDAAPLFSKTVEPKEGKSVKLSFYGEEDGGIYKTVKIIMSREGEGNVIIDVTKASGKSLHTSDGAVSDDGGFHFTAEDINFDGYTDFRIQGWLSREENISYFCYLWNNDNNTFEYAFALSNPVTDAGRGVIYSDVTDGGVEYIHVYEVKDGGLSVLKSAEIGGTVPFASDLSAYEQYMNPENRDGYLTLINTENLLDGGYEPPELYDVMNTRRDSGMRYMVPDAARALEALFIEMNEHGYTGVSVTDAYRSYEEQSDLYTSYINREMEEKGCTYEEAAAAVSSLAAAPEASEHRSGLCCDMHNLPEASQAFADEAAYGWLRENAWKFGFIVRYPEDKAEITKTAFAPWHFRYVGRYHAERITKLGMCLEEYIDYLRLCGIN